MATMIFKNKTSEDVVLADLGDATIPASTNKDLVNDLNLSVIDISLSDDLVEILGVGTDSYQMNNGDADLTLSDGIKFVTGVHQTFPIVPYNHRPIFRSDSRPNGMMSYFTEIGDDVDTYPRIGNGKEMSWDWSDDTTDVVTNTDLDALAGEYPNDEWPWQIPSGKKCKRLVVKFSEGVYLKEGTLYFKDASFGSFIDLMIVCPQNQYYYDRDGNPVQAVEGPVVIQHYCSHLQMAGDCPMGDEFNSEGCTESAIPSDYEWWMFIVVPDADVSSQGYVELEMYRPRTCLLPGESL